MHYRDCFWLILLKMALVPLYSNSSISVAYKTKNDTQNQLFYTAFNNFTIPKSKQYYSYKRSVLKVLRFHVN